MAEEGWGGPLWAAADLITPMAVRVAATLRVADLIAAGATTGRELAERLDVAADPLVRVLEHLVTAGFLRREAGGYALTDAGQWLRDDHPEGVRAAIDLTGALGHADLSVVELLHTVRTGEPAFDRFYGRGFWEDLAADAGRAASFDASMGRQAAVEAPAVAAAYDWASLGEVVDVGGGDGSLLIALLRAHPTLRGTTLDLSCETAARALAEAGLADRGRALAGSFFAALPPGAGGYLLSRVIHDWDDDHASRILRRCADAARPAGKVFVIEDTGDAASTEMDLRMLTYVRGRERSVEALTSLAHEAGLIAVNVGAVPGRSIARARAGLIEQADDVFLREDQRRLARDLHALAGLEHPLVLRVDDRLQDLHPRRPLVERDLASQPCQAQRAGRGLREGQLRHPPP